MYEFLLVSMFVTLIPHHANCRRDEFSKPLRRESSLQVSDNGPGVSGFPIQFTATYPTLMYQPYEFEFQDVDNKSFSDSVLGRESVSVEFTYFTDSPSEARMMRVTVWLQILGVRWMKMADVIHDFRVSKHLSGSVRISQDNTSRSALDSAYVASNEPFGIEFMLHDPSEHFNNFNKSYSWRVDNSTLPDDSFNVSYSIPSSGSHSVSVNMTVLTNLGPRSVSLDKSIVVQDRIEDSGVNVIGKYFIYRNESLLLKIKCSNISKQSGPFHYCTFLRNSTEDNSTDCPATATHYVTNRCDFSYSHYFHSPGKYQLMMQLWNEVSVWKEKIEITVMQITPVSALSFVVIPVLSVILVVIIITISVAIHLQQRKRYTVEVADFDFRPDISDEDLVEKTFIQRLKDSYREEVANGLWHCCSPSRQHLLGTNNDSDSINDLGYASTSVQT